MATVLEEFTTIEQRSVGPFLWTKGLNTKDIHKEMLPVYGGKCLSHKDVHKWVGNSLKDVRKFQMMNGCADLAKTRIKRLMLRVSMHW
jgi:hypothetical protein